MAKDKVKEHDPREVPYAPHDGGRPGLFPPELQDEADKRHQRALNMKAGRGRGMLAAAAPPELPEFDVGDDVGTLKLNTPTIIEELEALGYQVFAPGEELPNPPDPVDPPDPPDPEPGPDVPNPAPTTKGLTIQSNMDQDFEWKQSFASWWCDHKTDFKLRRLVIDGKLILPNPQQIEPKNFGADRYLINGLVVRNISSCKRGDAGNNSGDDVHTEGLYLGASNQGEIRNSYWGFVDGNTAVALFGTWFPDDGDVCDDLLIHNLRIDIGGVEGDGLTYWEGPIYYTFQGRVRNCIVRNAQIRRGAAGGSGHFGNQSQAWPHGPAWGGSGYWEYNGSKTGGNSGKGFEWVEAGQEWPDFPDGDTTLPKSLCNKGY